jgi:hypothetical protein
LIQCWRTISQMKGDDDVFLLMRRNQPLVGIKTLFDFLEKK